MPLWLIYVIISLQLLVHFSTTPSNLFDTRTVNCSKFCLKPWLLFTPANFKSSFQLFWRLNFPITGTSTMHQEPLYSFVCLLVIVSTPRRRWYYSPVYYKALSTFSRLASLPRTHNNCCVKMGKLVHRTRLFTPTLVGCTVQGAKQFYAQFNARSFTGVDTVWVWDAR